MNPVETCIGVGALVLLAALYRTHHREVRRGKKEFQEAVERRPKRISVLDDKKPTKEIWAILRYLDIR